MKESAEELRERVSEVERRIAELELARLELESAKKQLAEIKGEKGKELLAPLSGGIKLFATLADDERVLIDIGAGLAIKKDIEGAREMIDERIKEVKKAIAELKAEWKRLREQI